MPKLLSPLNLNQISLKNRIVMSPMCQYSSDDGFANDWHFVHYSSRAVGGVSAIIQEATAISPKGRISYKDLGLWKDEHMHNLNKIVDFLHKQNCLAGIQLSHAGRKASTPVPWNPKENLKLNNNYWESVAPSPIPFNSDSDIPKELTIQEINKIIQEFKEAAHRADKIGYDIVEIHAAHGYLIHQFLSPLSNKRTDDYGGNFNNRIQFLLEIISEVKNVLSKKVSLWVRISATDWIEEGWSNEDSIQLSILLKNMGVDVIDVSTGGLVNAKIPVQPNYQVPYAKNIKKETGIITGAVGLITNAIQAEEILENNEADFILLGRELLRNPYFPMEAASILGINPLIPPPYERAKIGF
ncbi:NADPH dehydrogenase NamA [Apibacter muscae]|uniref:NADPH dehydrogenase NamA n=1 Tax=Apibacter muscae TaxID=2509004 RepID=UPI0011ADF331|nr:NADPH dehydrogenase NamA [Apibacter muscae]TWP23309.1 NADPH dehydrogenase NamA [Apibacter muscae]